MKYLKSILEFNRKDKALILSSGINELFTVAFEFELETDDTELVTRGSADSAMRMFYKELEKALKEAGIKYDTPTIDFLITLIDLTDIEDTFDNLENETEGIDENILDTIYYLLDEHEKFVSGDNEETNLEYGIEMVEKHLPNFYKKYVDELKFNFDGSLERGIEFSPKKYIFSLTKSVEMINDFYNDFEKQDYWKMKNTTSIHINLGFTKSVEWNITKGLIMLGEIKKDEVPFVYKGMEYRANTNFTKSLLKEIKPIIMKGLKKAKLKTVKDFENFIEKHLGKILKTFGAKTFSVNIERIKNNQYVEFRHVGGKINKELVIDKLMYFAYITYLMTTDYKDNDYHKKLYKYIFSE